MVQFAISMGIFAEPTSRVVAHTVLSAILVRYPLMRSFVRFAKEETATSALKVVEAQQPNSARSAFQIAYDTVSITFSGWRIIRNM